MTAAGSLSRNSSIVAASMLRPLRGALSSTHRKFSVYHIDIAIKCGFVYGQRHCRVISRSHYPTVDFGA